MTTTAIISPPARPVAPPQAVVAADDDDINDVTVAPPPGSAGAGYLLLPLSEFGQSLDNPGLDCWFEGFAGRNRAQAEYEITAQGDLKIMPPTGFPFDWYEAETTADVVLHARRHGGLAGGLTSRFILPDGSRRGPDAWWISPERWRSSPPEARQPPFAAIVPRLYHRDRIPLQPRPGLGRQDTPLPARRRPPHLGHQRPPPPGNHPPPRNGTGNPGRPGTPARSGCNARLRLPGPAAHLDNIP